MWLETVGESTADKGAAEHKSQRATRRTPWVFGWLPNLHMHERELFKTDYKTIRKEKGVGEWLLKYWHQELNRFANQLQNNTGEKYFYKGNYLYQLSNIKRDRKWKLSCSTFEKLTRTIVHLEEVFVEFIFLNYYAFGHNNKWMTCKTKRYFLKICLQ